MSWNYRVVRKKDSCGNVSFGIHEAYYNKNDVVVSITQNPIQIIEFEEDNSDGLFVDDINSPTRIKERLHSQLEHMIDGLTKPIIPFESVGSNYAEGCGSLR